MPDPVILRDSTQLVLPSDVLEEFRVELDDRFTLTFFEMNTETDREYVRVIGSPVEIGAASEFLSRRGVPLR